MAELQKVYERENGLCLTARHEYEFRKSLALAARRPDYGYIKRENNLLHKITMAAIQRYREVWDLYAAEHLGGDGPKVKIDHVPARLDNYPRTVI